MMRQAGKNRRARDKAIRNQVLDIREVPRGKEFGENRFFKASLFLFLLGGISCKLLVLSGF
jgi:hypothetical protein